MRIHITGHQLEITPALRTMTIKKFDKLERHFDKINNINVIFGIEKLLQVAEATVSISKCELHASSSDTNMYTAIDSLVNKLDRQLIKHKEKNLGHQE